MEPLPLAIFLLAYAAISVPALPERLARRLPLGPRAARAARLLLDRPGVAVIGGLLMVLAGAVAPREAAAAVDLGTLALLLGMMLLVAGLEAANFFAVMAAWLVRRFPTPRSLLVGVMVTTAVLSALLLNDAVVLLLTPVLVKATREMGLDPAPFLIGEAVAANVGSVATPVGNPQNAYIAVAADLSFPEFARVLLPVAAASLLVAVALALLFFRNDLRAVPAAPSRERPAVSNPAMLRLALAATGALLVLFALGRAVPLNLWQKAALAGAAVLALAWPVARVPPARLLRSVDWTILAFFVGLFVLIEGVRGSGLLAAFYDALGALDPTTLGGLAVVAAVLSNLVSNVPAVLLLADAVATAADSRLWLTLAATSTLAGNATILGAAANVIVAQTARAFGADLDPWRFLAFGLPLTVATVALATGLLAAAPP